MGMSSRYPPNWRKVSRTIRRVAGWRCEQCHVCNGRTDATGHKVQLSVHHIGVPYADGRTGDPHEKHYIRRENLIALCERCHEQADQAFHRRNDRQQRILRRWRRRLHARVQARTFKRLRVNPWYGDLAASLQHEAVLTPHCSTLKSEQ